MLLGGHHRCALCQRRPVRVKDQRADNHQLNEQACFDTLTHKTIKPGPLHHFAIALLTGVARNNPTPSLTVMNWLAATSVSVFVCPLGQRISIVSTLSRLPRPKWTRRSFCE